MATRTHLLLPSVVAAVAIAAVGHAANVDVVVRPPKALTVKLAAGTASAQATVAIEVANAASDVGNATVRLAVTDGDCPAGVVSGTPDFGKKHAASIDTIVLAPGKKAKAKVPLTIAAIAFTSVAPKVPTRCALAVTASVVDPAGNVDPTPANASTPLTIDVLDANDAAPPALAEVTLATLKPLVLTTAAGKPGRKVVKVAVGNASVGGGLGTPDADVAALTVSGDCPAGLVDGIDFEKAAGNQASTRVRAGKHAGAKLALTADAATMPPGTKASPARCVLTVAAQSLADSDASNDVVRLVVDVIGGTGTLPAPNHAPTASFTVGAATTPLVPVAFDGSASSDPDGDPLTYTWSFGDGVAGGGATLAHAYANAGTFTVRLTVADKHGATAFVEHDVVIGAGEVAQGTVPAVGVVKTVGGAVLAGVGVVADGGGTATSDGNGKVTVNVPRGIPFQLTLTKAGFVTQFLPLTVPVGAEGAIFEATMLTRAATQPVNAAIGGTLAGEDGATLILPPGGLVDGSGAPVAGFVQVGITPVDPVSAPHSFPGRYAGITAAGDDGLLLSHGTVEFVMTKNGVPVQLAPGATATIEIPLYATLDKDGSPILPSGTIALWSLDEKTGGWVQEGNGTVVTSNTSPTGLALRATVGHLSWWNADKFDAPPYKPKPKCMVDTNADGILEDLTGTGHCWNAGTGPEQPPPLGGTPLRLPGGARATTPRIPAYAAQAEIPAAGGVVLPVPANVDITIRASAKGGTLLGTKILHGAPGVEEEVQILLKPLVFEDATPITIPWDQTYTMTVGAVHQYRFDATAGEPVYVTVSRTQGSQLKGTVLVQGASADDFGIGPTSFDTKAAKLGFFVPTSGTYRVVIDGTSGEPGGYHLQVAATGTVPLLVSTVPADGASAVDPATPVSATFTTSLDPTSVTAVGVTPTFNVFGPLGTVAGTAIANGATATFTPADPLDAGVAYTARVTTGVRASTGESLSALHEWGFTVAGSNAVTPLAVGSHPDLAVGPTGEAFVVYQQENASLGTRGTTVSRFVPAEGWKPGEIIRTPGNVSVSHSIAASADGTVVLVWRTSVSQSTQAVFASRYTPADGWSAPETIDGPNGLLGQALPKVGVDDDGNAVALWKLNGVFVSRRYVAGVGWDPSTDIFPLATPLFQDAYDLFVAPTGQAVAARAQSGVLNVRRFLPASGWQALEPFAGTSGVFAVSAGIDGAGNILVVWKDTAAYRWRRYDAATQAWDDAQVLFADTTSHNLGSVGGLQVLVQPNGSATASGTTNAVVNNVPIVREWSMRFDGAQKTWGPILDVTSDIVCSRRIATDATGGVAYTGWIACNGGPPHVRWKKYTTANGWDANATEIPGENIDGVTQPPEHIALLPGGGALLIYGRSGNADSAVLAAQLP